ncbi:hypothetical protein OG439_32540 [Amycolatopsis sp. NBC_01307]|uniref:hypothetical protein n=1 Tax=Amycolatopsis sp. NBC_01307 TaxID=2903561 RepID=UPI002E13A17F|nr:hypothetical protein OG439_32540 [Amycolatopsis sp. NBC_01307]
MTDRLFVPAELSGLLTKMPPAAATPFERLDWLDRTHNHLRQLFTSSHGLVAMRMARVIDQARSAAHDEFDRTTSSAA